MNSSAQFDFAEYLKQCQDQKGHVPLLLAPMEDVTDVGFRTLCKRFGAAVVYSEFVSADALVREVNSTLKKLTIDPDERPVGIQIYGRDVESMVEAARMVEREAHPDMIDLNFGCPVKKVANKGGGAGLLRNVPLMLDIAREVAKAVSTPVTAKTRLGWDSTTMMDASLSIPGADHEPLIIELAERLQDCGVTALTIHGRTRAQMYTGEADWSLIGKVKCHPHIHIPIIGNGDIKSIAQAEEAQKAYGVDAVMVGRATFGQPWIFSEREPSIDEKIDILKEQLAINISRTDERRGILHTRRHLASSPVFKGIPNFREMRIAMLRADTEESLVSLLEESCIRIKNLG